MREARGPAWTDWLAEHGVVALTGVDTRALVLHLREHGAMRAGIGVTLDEIRALPRMEGQSLAAGVSTTEAVRRRTRKGTSASPSSTTAASARSSRAWRRRARPSPSTRTTWTRTSWPRYDGVAPLQRPRRPGAARPTRSPPCPSFSVGYPCSASASATSCSRWRRVTRRTSCRSVTAARTTRCSTATTGRVLVTSQNHGFAVRESEERAATHVSLYDGTVEGLDYPELRARSLQFHPEAGPGPHDARPLIDSWVEELRAAA